MPERISLFDTTLRDGAQTQGVDFSVDDKRAIARALDSLNIDYIEGGWPGANPVDDDFFATSPNLNNATCTAFGMTRRPDHSAANDPGLNALLTSAADAVCMVGKTWDFHVDVALGISLNENIAMIADSVAHATTRVGEALFDAEHFFDGYKVNPDFALSCLKAALDAGARWSSCATPMAAPCPLRSHASLPKSPPKFPATIWASMPMTIPATRWRIRSPRSKPERARCRAR